MTDLLIHTFIKNYENTKDEHVRSSYGTLASIAGMCCNLILFALKFTAGTLCGSIAVVSDAFNNLSDCLSNIVSLFGYRLASKPADKEHPFGHGRMEYIVSLFISGLILIVAWELFTDGIEKVIHPSSVKFEWLTVLILTSGIAVKFWMYLFYKKIAGIISNPGLKASALDSASDVLATAVTLISMILNLFFANIPFDGAAGILLSVLIFKNGIDIAGSVISRLLGGPADRSLADAIERIVVSYPEITGMHDLIIHDYGAGFYMGSAHAEMDSRMTLEAAHEIADLAERRVKEELHVDITLHIDPVNKEDPLAQKYYRKLIRLLKGLDQSLSVHDFQYRNKDGKAVLAFDVLIPYDSTVSQNTVNAVISAVFEEETVYVNYDHNYMEEK